VETGIIPRGWAVWCGDNPVDRHRLLTGRKKQVMQSEAIMGDLVNMLHTVNCPMLA